ncbi:Gill-specific calpain [Fasciola gigantica]|uniref:Gill-specific calpain n=1 Tax=Fasciola gigantica TaxID=46835 RepID=A0A504YWV2_FASGI|nr:Gill-specific calpain [Fasciola gigantica]
MMTTIYRVREPSNYHNRTVFGKHRETARGALRRHRDEATVWDSQTHLSTSLDESRKWFRNQVQLQRQRGGLFEDPFLRADSSGIGRGLGGPYEWLRPHQLTSSPKFVADGISRFDVKQGEIGDCWLLAAVASLSMHRELLENVIPAGQSFDEQAYGDYFPYCGMFWFRLWRFGDWIDVVVDDRLPSRNRHLVFMHSSDRREFWSALLEKAYAKVIGSYGLMRGGCTAEAMEDFTGGLTEIVDLGDKTPPRLFRNMVRSHARSSLMACSIDSEVIEGDGPMGLITGHAYSVTDVCVMKTNRGPLEMVRLRNPWGNEKEWYGPWSDQSSEWKSISPQERQRIGLTFENDGEFWMTFSDFSRYFSRLEFCHLGPENTDFGKSVAISRHKRRWEMTKEEGEWVRYATAGGCRNFQDTFHINPQFRVEVTDPDESDDDNLGTLIVGLMQKSRRKVTMELQTIGYAIYRLSERNRGSGILGKAFFLANQSVARSPTFTNLREVCGRHRLEPGQYVIIPSTYEPNNEAQFILRIFSERSCTSNEIDDDTNISKEDDTISIKVQEDVDLIERLRVAYNGICGPSGVIAYPELRDILNAAFTKGAHPCYSQLLSWTDLSGFLSFEQFKKLWMDLRLWKSIFKRFDRNQSGYMDAFELRELMKTLGFRVSNRVYNAIVCRYANRQGQILFDDYVLLLVRLVTVVETFKAQERLNDGRSVFSLEEFTRYVIYI